MTGVEPQVRRGRTGDTIRTHAELDALPPGTVVVPQWTGSAVENGLNACTKFAPNRRQSVGVWLRAIDNPNDQSMRGGVFPLGPTIRPEPVVVVYDPRDV